MVWELQRHKMACESLMEKPDEVHEVSILDDHTMTSRASRLTKPNPITHKALHPQNALTSFLLCLSRVDVTVSD